MHHTRAHLHSIHITTNARSCYRTHRCCRRSLCDAPRHHHTCCHHSLSLIRNHALYNRDSTSCTTCSRQRCACTKHVRMNNDDNTNTNTNSKRTIPVLIRFTSVDHELTELKGSTCCDDWIRNDSPRAHAEGANHCLELCYWCCWYVLKCGCVCVCSVYVCVCVRERERRP